MNMNLLQYIVGNTRAWSRVTNIASSYADERMFCKNISQVLDLLISFPDLHQNL
jgi:hypothetical protein